MKTLYFDCFSGISGDMTLAALTDLGVPREYLTGELEKLHIKGLNIEFSRVEKNGVSAAFADVVADCGDDEHSHRSHKDIVRIIDESGVSDGAKKISKKIFKIIALAEARVHGVSSDDVHFHEVGALDSIADVVGTGICIDYLKPERIISSVINEGRGFTYCRHGKIPVPVPAVMEIFGDNKVPINQINVDCELVTPTGAGIVAALAEGFSPINNLVILKTGYGAGKKDLEHPNILRVHMCESAEDRGDVVVDVVDDVVIDVVVIEANIDDQTPETLSFAMDRLMEAGAKDVFFTPIQMKKNRPACLLTVICDNKDLNKMSGIIFVNTSTFGVRYTRASRICLEREIKKVDTPYGEVQVKVGYYEGREKISPEYESAKRIALQNGVPVDDIYKSAILSGEIRRETNII